MKNFVTLIYFAAILSFNGFGSIQKKGLIDFKVQITDPNLIGKDITIEHYHYYNPVIGGIYCEKFTQKITGETISFSIDQSERFEYIKISLPDPYMSIGDNLFLAESGDKMILNLSKGKISFLGKGAEKYNCQLEMTSIVPEITPDIPADQISILKNELNEKNGVLKKQLTIISKYQNSLDVEDIEILRANVRYQSYSNALTDIIFRFRQSSDSVVRRTIQEIFNEFIDKVDSSGMNAEMELNSSSYIYYLYLKEKCLADLHHSVNDPNSDYGFNELHQNILEKYSGAVRDRILTTLIFSVNFFGKVNMLDVLTKDLALIGDPSSKDLLVTRHNALGRGQKAYNFKLIDDHDKWVSLDDFRGKVVILDFYFNGCSACATLTKAIGPIYDAFIGNTQVAFISISIDNSKEIFHKSIKTGIYTHKGGINLYTNGEGENHEIIKYYGITGYPKLIIIGKEGTIVDGDPPIPLLINGSTSGDKLRSIIDHAIIAD